MGVCITFDGMSGTGKGTIIACLRDRLIAKGRRVAILESRRFDPFREYGAKMLPWCNENDINRHLFMLPLFAVGNTMFDRAIASALGENDVVVVDRSWITNLGYVPASTDLAQLQVWDLYVNHLGVRLPDCAVIVDCDASMAMERTEKRTTHIDMGVGGKMSGDLEHRKKIRKEFLSAPQVFAKELNWVVAANNGAYSDDEETVRARVDSVVGEIMVSAAAKGVML